MEGQIKEWINLFEKVKIPKTVKFEEKKEQELSIRLIEEEWNETKEAFKEEDLVGVLDGLGDSLWVIMRAMIRMGASPSDIINIIYKANMSKMCNTPEEVHDTIEYYKEKDSSSCTVKKASGKFILYRESDNKVLKNIHFNKPEPELKKYIEESKSK